MTFDLVAMGKVDKFNAAHTIKLKHPDGRHDDDGKPVEIGVEIDYVGFESEAADAARYENFRLRDKLIVEGGEFTQKVRDEELYRLMAKCTTGWRGVPMAWVDGSDNSEAAPFTPENALKLYNNYGVRWIRPQLMEVMGAHVNFDPASSND